MPSKGFQKVIIARSQLVLNEAFWAPLITKPKIVEDPKAYKMWTDGGVHFGFNPKWAADDKTTIDDIISRICEMTVHVSNEHHFRMIGMDPEDANKAADYASWAILKNAGYPLPNDVYYSPDYNGLSMEAIYNLIHVEKPPQPASQPQPQEGAGAGSEGEGDEQDGEGEGDEDGDQESDKPANPGSDGEIRPLPANVNAEEHRHEWREAVLQAAQAAEAAGKMPAGMRQLVERIKNPQIPWREQLRKLVQPIIINQDFSYARPNRRWAPQGIFMPELRSERMPAGVILWDTSGSRDDEKARATAGAEVVSIIDEFRPEKLYVMYVDTEVHHVDVFEPDDIITFNPKGGGGTDFSSAFRHIEEQGWEPSFFVGITDMYATFPDKEPDYPVVWASTTDRPAPFGEVVRIKD